MFRTLGSIRLEARELHSSVWRLLVVAREEHNEVSRVLNRLVHLLDKVRSNRNVVVLDENLVALLGKNPGDLLRNSCHRATTAQEEVVSLTGTAWHGTAEPLLHDVRAQGRGNKIPMSFFKSCSTFC